MDDINSTTALLILFAAVSADGLRLIFSSNRPEGSGDYDLWVSTRSTVSDPWGPAVNLGQGINTIYGESGPSISGDGLSLYFCDYNLAKPGGSGGIDIWQIPIIPIVDLNGDGVVDSTDMSIMMYHWGQNEPLCDIGPTPLGDGVVDVQDLIVLAEHLVPGFESVAHWKLDETEGTIAHDSIGGSEATVMGDATWQPEGGLTGGALELDGVDDHVATDFVSNPRVDPVRVVAWINSDVAGGAIISQTPGAAFGSTWLGTDPSDGTLMTGMMFPLPALPSKAIVADGRWHEVAIEWDGTYRRLWVDKQAVSADALPVTVPPIHMDGAFNIGAGANLESGSFFSGLIDDVRIYNRAVRP